MSEKVPSPQASWNSLPRLNDQPSTHNDINLLIDLEKNPNATYIRQLPDYISNQWQTDPYYFDDLDDDDASTSSDYMQSEKEPRLPLPKFLTSRIPDVHIPRRLQRHITLILAAVAFACFGWFYYVGPAWSEHRMIDQSLAKGQEAHFGANIRPAFSDMVFMKELDPALLPGEEGSGREDRRLVFVGDVHGCRKELEHLLTKVVFNPKKDHLLATGDLINKGPDSAGVIDLLISLNASSVRGNHEDRVLLAHAAALQEQENQRLARLKDSPDQQAQSPISSAHGDDPDRRLALSFSHRQLKWLSSLPVILRIGTPHAFGSELVMVHAGLVPHVPLASQDPFQVMNMRVLVTDKKGEGRREGGMLVPSEDRKKGVPWVKFWNRAQEKLLQAEKGRGKHRGEKEERLMTVVYGHDAKVGLNLRPFTKGLDSGCVKGGKLTALVVDARGRSKVISVRCPDSTAKSKKEKKETIEEGKVEKDKEVKKAKKEKKEEKQEAKKEKKEEKKEEKRRAKEEKRESIREAA